MQFLTFSSIVGGGWNEKPKQTLMLCLNPTGSQLLNAFDCSEHVSAPPHL